MVMMGSAVVLSECYGKKERQHCIKKEKRRKNGNYV